MSDASTPEASDSTLENVQRELENARADMEKVTVLQSTEGVISSPSDGVIKKVCPCKPETLQDRLQQ